MTLSFKKLGKGGGGGDYYLSASVVVDYLTSGSTSAAGMREPPGKWFDPSGGLRGGLHGEQVAARTFRALLGGFDPKTGVPLVRGAGDQHVSGYDFTFSVPKGVSVLWSQLPDPMRAELEAVQAEAVSIALQFMAKKAGVSRRGVGGATKERVELIAALWPHASSRENDPQLHTHCTVLNLARCEDGAYRTIDVSQILRWQSAIASIYHAQLAALLIDRLGLRCEVMEGDVVFDCHDVPASVRDHWSKRSAQIKTAAAGRDRMNASKALLDRLTVETRNKKQDLTRVELAKRWRGEGEQIGFTKIHAESCVGIMRREKMHEDEVLSSAYSAVEGLTLTQSVFTESQIYAVVGVAMQGRGDAKDVEHAVRTLIERGNIHRIGTINDGSLAVYSTLKMIQLERDMVDAAADMAPSHVLAIATVENAIQGKQGLSDEQAEAVRHACLGRQRVVIVEGAAGAGKSYAMEAVKAAYEAEGYELIGLALSWSAASVLSESAKIERTRAIEGFVRDLAKGKVALTDKSVIVIDEAGLVGSRHMAEIVKAVKVANARLILTGEATQLSPADAGGAMAALIEKLGSAHMDEVRRQGAHVRHAPLLYSGFQWQREAVLQFRDGHAAKALDQYRRAGCVRFSDNAEGAINAMLSDWIELRLRFPDKATLLLANDNATVREINQRVRDRLIAEGIVGEAAISIRSSDLRRSVEASFAVGDRVMFRMNDRELGIQGDGAKGSGVFNRSVGTLLAISEAADGTPMLSIELDRGGIVEIRAGQGGYFDKKSGGVPIQHAYATTIYASQGMTVDETFLLDSRHIDRRLAYVGASRHRERCRFYLNRAQIHEHLMERSGADEYRPVIATNDDVLLKAVMQAWSRNSEKMTTVQFLQESTGSVTEERAANGRHLGGLHNGTKRRLAPRRRKTDLEQRKNAAHVVDLPEWLIRRGLQLVRRGLGAWMLLREAGKSWQIFRSTESATWMAHDGSQTLGPIEFVQQHWGVRPGVAVRMLAGDRSPESLTRLSTRFRETGVGREEQGNPDCMQLKHLVEAVSASGGDNIAQSPSQSAGFDVPAEIGRVTSGEEEVLEAVTDHGFGSSPP